MPVEDQIVVLATTPQGAPIPTVGEAINKCGNKGSISIMYGRRGASWVSGDGGGGFPEEVTSELSPQWRQGGAAQRPGPGGIEGTAGTKILGSVLWRGDQRPGWLQPSDQGGDKISRS